MGGCFEPVVTTHDHPTFDHSGVIHYCVPNIPGALIREQHLSPLAISHAFTY
jgi:alanine dehydrogenase